MRFRFPLSSSSLLASLVLASSFRYGRTTDYYVSHDGTDDVDSGTAEDDPFRTIQFAVDRLEAGDTLFVREGTYHEAVEMEGLRGTANDPILITNYPNERVVLDGTEDVNDISVVDDDDDDDWSPYYHDSRHADNVFSRSNEGSNDGIFKRRLTKNVTQLFVDDRYQIIARWPNAETHPADELVRKPGRWEAEEGSWWDKETTWAFADTEGTNVDGTVETNPAYHDLAATGLSFEGGDAMTKDGKGSNERARSPHLLSSLARSDSSGNPLSSPTTPSSSGSPSISSLYHPSIFRYTCTGKLSVDSRNGGQSKASSGVCHGIQSKLEHIDHWRLSTREEAIKQFEDRSSMDVGGAEEDYYNSGGDPAGASSAHAEQAVYISNVLLYPPPSTPTEGEDCNCNGEREGNNERGESECGKNRKKNKETINSLKNMDGSTTIRPKEDKIDCYGSTEIDLLVLRPQNAKDESIAGVSSYCAPGMTVRDVVIPPTNIGIGAETGGRERTTTFRLGILEVVYATVLEGLEEDERNTSGSSSSDNQGKSTSNGDKGDEDSRTAIANGWLPSGAPTQLVSSGKKILNHMSINGQLLYQSVQDEYPTRTYEASKRITNEFYNTWDRTTGLMKKVASFVLFGDDWDGDDDDDANRT